MNVPPRWRLAVALFFALCVGGLVVTFQRLRPISPGAITALYHCPMHPSYTSNRPGDCPICGMRLVKTESPHQEAQPMTGRESLSRSAKTLSSICYLHNCTKLHEGKPCPMTVIAKRGERVTCPICGTHIVETAESPATSIERKLLYWTDPMIPGYKSDKPGKSPMGMDLVPVYEEHAGGSTPSTSPTPEGYAPILLTPQKQQLIGVRTAPVERRPLNKTIRTVGVVAHDPELYQAEQEFIQAYQAQQQAQQIRTPEILDQATRLLESSRFRLRHLGLSEELINEISTWTQPDHRLLLGGAGEYWVYASIYEYEFSLVQPGQSVTMDIGALPGHSFAGTVKAIDPMLDPTTRTARARILVKDLEGLLKPAMYVNVSIAVALGTVVTVPEEAVFATGRQQIVFVDQGQGLFVPRSVILGPKADRFYEVKSGLKEGEPVVTSGNFLIDSESRLKGALQQQAPSSETGQPASEPSGADNAHQPAQ